MIKNAICFDSSLIISVSGQGGPYHSGTVIWDGNAQKMRVVDGQGVAQDMYGQDLSIGAGPYMSTVLAWAYKKMAEEEQLDKLCKAYPNLEDARREFEILKQIVKDHK